MKTTRPSPAQLQFLQKQKRHKYLVYSARLLLLFGFLLTWELTSHYGIIDSFIFSSPSALVQCFWSMVTNGSIFLHLSMTLYETILSFLLVTLISLGVTILLWFSKGLSETLEPFLVVLNSLPKSALAPLLIVWLGATPTTIIVAGMSVALFGSILSLYTSFTTVDSEKLKLVYTLRGSSFHALTKVVIPSCIPAILSNMKVNIGLCLVGVIIGEFLAARSGLGYLIIYGSQVFKLDWLLMSICILCILAMGLYILISLIEKLYQKYF